VRIRGAEADQTLVLIDGVQINDPSSTGGGFDFGNLLVGDISRIEVLRGSQSTLYGSQAIGGVINIVTAEPDGELKGALQAEYGSMDSSQAKGSVGGRFDRLSFRVGGARYRTDSVSAYGLGTEDDAFRDTTFAARLGYELAPSVGLDLRGYYADGRTSYDGYAPPTYAFGDAADYGRNRQFVGYAGLNFALLEGRLQNRLAIQDTDTDRRTYTDIGAGETVRSGRYKGGNRRYEYQASWQLGARYSAVFGLQREDSDMHSEAAPQFAKVRQDSAYLQLQGEVADGLTLTGGARYDDHDTFGSHDSLQLAAAWALSTGTVLRASWGEGFKAPTLYQLFSDSANPELRPEVSRGWDAGVEQHFADGRARVSATYFRRRTRNQISYVNCPFPLNAICASPGHSTWGYYENTALSQADGIELQAGLVLTPRLDVTANYTHMKAEDRSPGAATYGQRLLRRPDDLANLAVNYRWSSGLSSSVALRHTGASYDMNFNVFPEARVSLAAYTLVDLRLAYAINESLELAGRVENLFGEDYTTVYEYGTTGRAGYVSLKLRFQP
jgi:vitamin B12 transporter